MESTERTTRAVGGKRIVPRLIVAGLALTLFTASIPVFAQERFGEIKGVVTDPSNAVVPSAAVTLTNKDINRTISLNSGTDGSYLATDIEPGHYKIRVEAAGFSASEI